MEVITNNKDVLYSRLNQTVNAVAKEKPYGDLTTTDILEVLAKLRDDFIVLFARRDFMEDFGAAEQTNLCPTNTTFQGQCLNLSKTMGNEIDIAELLKGPHKGIKLWSPICGDCHYHRIDEDGRIVVADGIEIDDEEPVFFPNGKVYDKDDTECLLFPSRDCRTWKNFNAPWKRKHFEPFQRVLVNQGGTWIACLYSHYDASRPEPHVLANGLNKIDEDVIPYEGCEGKLGKEVGA